MKLATISSIAQGTKGIAVDNEDGTFTYTRNAASGTTDSFVYTLISTDGVTSSATVTVTTALSVPPLPSEMV